MKILFTAGALREGSFNKKFAQEAMRLAKALGHDGEFVDLRDYPMPVYDGDIESKDGIPEKVKQLGEKIAAADAIVLSTPEYNGSIPGILKNAVDWVSRLKPVPIEGKQLLLIGASPGALGAVRSLWHSRQPFDVLGVHVYPAMMGLALAHEAFDEAGKLKDEKKEKQLRELLEKFLKHAGNKA